MQEAENELDNSIDGYDELDNSIDGYDKLGDDILGKIDKCKIS
jgi:hypothetical protein